MSITGSLGVWIPQVQGRYLNEDGAYGAQCWDLAANWSTYLGLPVINTGGAGRWPGWAGNMVDAFPQSDAIAAAYTLHGPGTTGQAGDIVVWDDSYWYYPATHVAVLVADKGPQLLCMSQNSTPSRADNPYPEWTSGPTTIQSLPRQGLLGFIRPGTGDLDLAPQGTVITITPTTSEEDEMSEAAELDISRVRQILESWEGNGLLARVIAMDQRTLELAETVKYVKGADEPQLYEILEDTGALRNISGAEWEVSGRGYRTLPQATINRLLGK